MGLLEYVASIAADSALSASEKSRQIANAKASGWRSAILAVGVLPQTWGFTANGAAWTITLASVTVTDGMVSFDGTVTKNGITLTRNADGSRLWPICVQNPPLLFDDPSGTITQGARKLKYDLIALARSVFASVVVEAVP